MSHYHQSRGSRFQRDRQQPVAQSRPFVEGAMTVLFMGDLDQSWTEQDVKNIWAQLGEHRVQVRLIRGRFANANNAGYCFVDFSDPTVAKKVLLKNGARIPNTNRNFALAWATGNVMSYDPSFYDYSVFVGDLSPNTTESQLFETFVKKYPSTSSARIMFDQQTGASKNYGFVKFSKEADHQRCLNETIVLNGRQLRISQTQNKGPAPPSHSQPQPAAKFAPEHQLLASFPVLQQPMVNQHTDPNNTTVFIGRLSDLVTEQELRSFFEPFGPIVSVKIAFGKNCGFVQYVLRRDAELAISQMQGYQISGSRVRLSWGTKQNHTPYQQQPATPAIYGYVPRQGLSQTMLYDMAEPLDVNRANNNYIGHRGALLNRLNI